MQLLRGVSQNDRVNIITKNTVMVFFVIIIFLYGLYYYYMNLKKGFTLLELLLVIAIIGILATIVITAIGSAKDKAQTARAKQETNNMATAFELYNLYEGGYPADVGPGVMPVGMEPYLPNWPNGSYPGAEYDWDYWDAGTDNEAVQISVRFCESGTCAFPDEDWAEDFVTQSAAYYCISGSCRSWETDLVDAIPGYCFNC